MKAGDVVFGCFPVKSGTLADHHSVVAQVMGDSALIVYTTSVKEGDPVNRRALSREFTPGERELANWPNRCRYDASSVAVVPVKLLKVRGRVPTATLQEISQAVQTAVRDKRLDVNHYNPAFDVRATGRSVRGLREAGVH